MRTAEHPGDAMLRAGTGHGTWSDDLLLAGVVGGTGYVGSKAIRALRPQGTTAPNKAADEVAGAAHTAAPKEAPDPPPTNETVLQRGEEVVSDVSNELVEVKQAVVGTLEEVPVVGSVVEDVSAVNDAALSALASARSSGAFFEEAWQGSKFLRSDMFKL